MGQLAGPARERRNRLNGRQQNGKSNRCHGSLERLRSVPTKADPSAVADASVKVVDTPLGKRPFRVHVDPTQDGAEVVNTVSDRVRAELLRRIGLTDVLTPRVFTS